MLSAWKLRSLSRSLIFLTHKSYHLCFIALTVRGQNKRSHECEDVRLPQRTIFFSTILFPIILFSTILLSQIYLLFNSFSTMPWHTIVPQAQTEGGDMPFSKYPKLLKVYLYEERRIGQKRAENTVRIPPKSCRDISVGIRTSTMAVNREGHSP